MKKRTYPQPGVYYDALRIENERRRHRRRGMLACLSGALAERILIGDGLDEAQLSPRAYKMLPDGSAEHPTGRLRLWKCRDCKLWVTPRTGCGRCEKCMVAENRRADAASRLKWQEKEEAFLKGRKPTFALRCEFIRQQILQGG